MKERSIKSERFTSRSDDSSRNLGAAAREAQKIMHDSPGDNEKLRKENEQLKKENEALRIDVTTGILTRTAFDLDLQKLLERPMEEVSLVVIDLKSMKYINDAFGHKAGDIFLNGVASRLQDILSKTIPGHLLARIGGDEFTIVGPELTDEQKEMLAEYLNYLFDDNESDDENCWIPISDTEEVCLRGRYTVEHIDNGSLTAAGLAEAYATADKRLTEVALNDGDRGKPTRIRSITPR